MKTLLILAILFISNTAYAADNGCAPMMISNVSNVDQGVREFSYNVKIFLHNKCSCSVYLKQIEYQFRDMNGNPAAIDTKDIYKMLEPNQSIEIIQKGKHSHPVPIDKTQIHFIKYFDRQGC